LNLDDDDFEIFGLERRFAIDAEALEARRRTLQGQVHPDRFAAQGAAARRVAAQWSVRVNEAYARLRDPVRRAAALCELAGVDLAVERNTAMPPAFLMRQMAWREALEDAADVHAVERVAQEVRAEREATLASIGMAIDERQDFVAAADCVRSLMFMDRFLDDVDRRLEAFDD
jgi:molecular chaperone HscB